MNEGTQQDKKDIKIAFENQRKDKEGHIYASPSFSKRINDYYKTKIEKNPQSILGNLVYILLQPCLIAIFCGFVLGFIPSLQSWWFNTTTSVFMFEDTFNQIGNAHIVCLFLIIGVNLYYSDRTNYEARFTRQEYLVQLLLKTIILPFIGLIFISIAQVYISNRALLFTAFIQWFMPSTADILIICQSKLISPYSVCMTILIQYIIMTVLGNFLFMGPLMKILGLL